MSYWTELYTTNIDWRRVRLDLDLKVLRAVKRKDVITYHRTQFQIQTLFGKELNIPFNYEWGVPK